ncbi:unnamed protein product (mitochondrion) [Plasmodiophora brassicae]|uniref:Uncharacterized protein n=1 Tax=Plasmodiophora brassicae TaxID=37360 RepID=A0A3P3YG69_PLABS|nr:unnamed protein product [Plasmodiophora brassicae]
MLKSTIPLSLQAVRDRIASAMAASTQKQTQVELIAVSMSKARAAILQAYTAGQRKFGELHASELRAKCEALPDDCEWHFIGHLKNSAVCKALVKCKNIAMVETVPSINVADSLQRAVSKSHLYKDKVMDVLVQVRTGPEPADSGCTVEQSLLLAHHVHRKCKSLRFRGIMGIAKSRKCYRILQAVRAELSAALKLEENDLILSLGNSTNFEDTIAYGATQVRVGTAIFGKKYVAFTSEAGDSIPNWDAEPGTDSDGHDNDDDTRPQMAA